MSDDMNDLRQAVEAGALEDMTPAQRKQAVLKLLDNLDAARDQLRKMEETRQRYERAFEERERRLTAAAGVVESTGTGSA
jgi:hypothetical protein